MRIRPSVAWLVIAAAALTLLVIWLGRKRTDMPLPPPEQTNEVPFVAGNGPTPSDQPSQPGTRASPLLQAGMPPANAPAGTNVAAPLPGSKGERMREVLSGYNDEPIVFYGKLEDQFGSPVSNAIVDFSVRVINGVQSTTEGGQVASDAGGQFTISGYKGQDLNVTPKKKGYAFASTNGWANYSRLFPEEERAHPDPNNPIIIKMWKLQGAEPLVGIDQHYKLSYTDAPICFDLLAGKVVPTGGDLKMTVRKVPGTVNSGEVWNVQVEAINGGLRDSTGQERTTYWAPAEGYQPTASLTFPTGTAGLSRSFFAVSRGGQVYSKLRISFRINEEADGFMYVAFRGVANGNGSRNWEGDPNTYKPQ